MKITISLAQMDLDLGRPEANYGRVRTLAQEAGRRGSQLFVLPELWSTGYDLERTATYAVPLDRGGFGVMAELAARHKMAVFGSCLSVLGPGRFGNTAPLVGPGGDVLGVYSKIHLFRLMQEEQFLVPGERPVMANCPWGKTGLTICYDLRFPELFRSYALAGAKLIVLCAEWPNPRLEHWRTLLRARAIENQLYVAACNRVGASGSTSFFGHSCVIDPWGEVVLEGGDDEALLSAEIDLDQVERVRAKIPVFADRRPDSYSVEGR